MGGHSVPTSNADPVVDDRWFHARTPYGRLIGRRYYWMQRGVVQSLVIDSAGPRKFELNRYGHGDGSGEPTERLATFPTLKAAKVAYLVRIAAC
jgi:hypothetical protein